MMRPPDRQVHWAVAHRSTSDQQSARLARARRSHESSSPIFISCPQKLAEIAETSSDGGKLLRTAHLVFGPATAVPEL